MKKFMVLGVSMLSAVAILAAGSPAAQADIIVGPIIPVLGQPVHLVLHTSPPLPNLDLSWI